MRVPKRILLMATLAMVGILGPQATPAFAHEPAGFVAVGTATTSGNLSSPVTPTCTLCPSPHVNFSVTAAGAGVLHNGALGLAGPLFSVSGHGSVGGIAKTGTVGPYCGLSSGSLNANWSFTGALGNFHSGATLHWTVGVGSVLLLTSTAPAAVVVAVALPPTPVLNPTGGSCLSGTAKEFTIVTAGVVALVVPLVIVSKIACLAVKTACVMAVGTAAATVLFNMPAVKKMLGNMRACPFSKAPAQAKPQ